MKALGIFRSNGLEIVDIETRDGAIIPKNCPGSLKIACNECEFSANAEHIPGDGTTPFSHHSMKKRAPLTFLLCQWHEKKESGPGKA